MKLNGNNVEASCSLIFHVHGGGFAAQTSKTHEVYLKLYANKLDVPILSIDYSLAPEAPFPRAIEEIFYAYCWALKNAKLLGSTGKNIVFVGDSAGGNLMNACLVRCIEMGICKPKGILNIYTCFNHSFKIIPSRFLTIIDSFLPFVLTMRFCKGYANAAKGNETDNFEESKQECKTGVDRIADDLRKEMSYRTIKSYLFSLYDAPEEILAQFPPSIMFTSNFDPFLDESIEFVKKLRRLNAKASMKLVKGLPHGFLHITNVRKKILRNYLYFLIGNFCRYPKTRMKLLN